MGKNFGKESVANAGAENEPGRDSGKWSILSDMGATDDSSVEKAEQQAKKFIQKACDIERKFRDEGGANRFDRAQFEFAEIDLFQAYVLANSGIELAEMNREKAAETMLPLASAVEPGESIEAQAGNMYGDNAKRLVERIREVGGEDSDKDAAYAVGLIGKARNYFDYVGYSAKERRKHDRGTSPGDYARSVAHSRRALVEHINGLNDLVDKYTADWRDMDKGHGVNRFTVRKLWQSGLNPDALSAAERSMAEYDERVAIEYCKAAMRSAGRNASREENEIAEHEAA